MGREELAEEDRRVTNIGTHIEHMSLAEKLRVTVQEVKEGVLEVAFVEKVGVDKEPTKHGDPQDASTAQGRKTREQQTLDLEFSATHRAPRTKSATQPDAEKGNRSHFEKHRTVAEPTDLGLPVLPVSIAHRDVDAAYLENRGRK
jgi:hypothetical protein